MNSELFLEALIMTNSDSITNADVLASEGNADDDQTCNWSIFTIEMLSYTPALIFFITGPCHFQKIRSIGFNRVV